MKIETKFNIGDKVWFKCDGEIINELVDLIEIHIYACSDGVAQAISYQGKSGRWSYSAFATKQELLNSL